MSTIFRTIHKDSLVPVTFKCKGVDKTIKVPAGHKKPYHNNYEEGSIITISYPDSSYIAIICGSNAELNLKDENTNLHGRKIYSDGLTIIYEHVRDKNLKYFERAFSKLEKK